MIVKKGSMKRPSSTMHLRYLGNWNIKMSSRLRDEFLPHTHVQVRIDGSKVTLIPTFDENDYKLSISKGHQMEFAWCHTAQFISIPVKENIIVQKNEDGTFSFNAKVREV